MAVHFFSGAGVNSSLCIGKGRLFLRCTFSLICAAASFSVLAKLPPEVARAAKQAGIPANAVSLYVRELGRPAPLIEHRSSVAMNPASTMKLVTTLVALDVLGADYQWKTDFLTTGREENGVLLGDLYIRGSGDPRFTWEHLETAIKALRARGLREIKGKLILDRSHFAATQYDTAAFDGQPLRPYNAAPDALLFNFSVTGLKFLVLPNKTLGIETVGPQSDAIEIVNQARVSSGICGDWRTKLSAHFEPGGERARATFTGTYAVDCGEREWYVALLASPQLLASTFARIWRDQGGLWQGATAEASTPKAARLLYSHASAPLSSMVTDINKLSNNVMARQLLISFDAQLNGAPGRADRGGRALREWAKLRGFDVPEIVIENGSGLSRKERISSESLAKFLEYGLTAPFANDFVKSLPIAATDGTLANRFVNGAANGQAYLKTGTLTGVKSLAGYLELPGKRRFLFVGLVNHDHAEQAVSVLDRAVEWVYQSVK